VLFLFAVSAKAEVLDKTAVMAASNTAWFFRSHTILREHILACSLWSAEGRLSKR
jgi:hypothetical protein